MSKKPTEQDPQLLRAAAEAHAAGTAAAPRPADEPLHELHVHQIELEMQNEQLRQAQLALEESRDRYLDIYEFAPVGYLTLTQQGIISEINLTGANLIGVERKKLLQRNFKYFIAPGYSEGWNNYLVNMVQTSRMGSCELALKRGDGHIFPVQLDCLHIKAGSEAPLHIAFTDITARKHAEEELRIASIAFETHDAMMVTDIKGVIVRVNRAFTRLTGYSAEEVVGKTPALLKSGRHDLAFYRRLWATLAMKRYWQGELWNRRKDGTVCADWLTISAVSAPDGRVTHYVSTYSDPTQNEALNRLQKIASRVPGVVYQYQLRPDGSSCFPFASDAIREIYRVSPEEVREDASKVLAIIHPDDSADIGASIQASARDLSPWRQEYRVKFDDGTVLWLFGNALPQKEADGSVLWHGFITDITERKQVEEKLRESEASMRAILDNSPYMSWLKDSGGHYVKVNKSYAEYVRLKDARQIIGKTDFDLWPRELAEKYRTDDDEVMATRRQKHVEEPSLDGDRMHWVETFKTPIIDENGNMLGTAGFSMDITERKQAEEKLQKFFDLIPELACIASTDGRFLKINPAWQSTLGYTEQEILSTPFLDFIHPDDRDATMKEVERQLAGEATIRFTNRYRRKDGSYRWLEWTASSDADKKLLYASARDITARKQAGE